MLTVTWDAPIALRLVARTSRKRPWPHIAVCACIIILLQQIGSVHLLVPVQGDMENAKKCFKHAIKCAPQHLEAHFNMGNLYRQCAEFGRAIQRSVRPCTLQQWPSMVHVADSFGPRNAHQPTTPCALPALFASVVMTMCWPLMPHTGAPC